MTIPSLESLHTESPSFEQWQEQQFSGFARAVKAEFTLIDAVVENANHIDLVFIALGIATAFGICSKAAKSRAAPAGRRRLRS